MKKIAIWIAGTVTVVVLLFGYHTSTDRTSALEPTPIAGQQPSTEPGSTGGGSGSKVPAGSRTFTGASADTERGPVQVQVVVADKKVTGVRILQAPTEDPMDVQINNYAVPILIKETISTQSAKIDMVSGATVTSGGYIESLQSALDQAGI